MARAARNDATAALHDTCAGCISDVLSRGCVLTMVGAMGDAAGVGQQCAPHATLLHYYDVDVYCYYGDYV